MIKEIRIHGRGGQGAVTAAQLLAYAAFLEGRSVQAFPHFGAERRGAPVIAFARMSDETIFIHSQIYNPDYVVVLDPKLHELVNVSEGLKDDGIMVINTVKRPEELGMKNWRVATVDATGIALSQGLIVAGSPVVNTSILGAFANATKEVTLENVQKAIRKSWSGAAGEKNAKAAELAFESLIKGW